jgi:hypothetical protein
MAFKNYMAWTIFSILFFWGPKDQFWSRWLCLILTPFIIWIVIFRIWDYFQLSDKVDDILNQILSVVISLGFLILAYTEFTSTTHIANTHRLRTKDGYIDLGEDIELIGPNYEYVFVYLIVAFLFLWIGVLNKYFNSSNSKYSRY